MDKIPWHCTTAGLDNSTELQTVKIHPVVDEICIPTHGKAHMGQMRKWPWWCTTTGLKFFKELWTEKIRPVVSETCALAHGQAHMGQMWKTLRNYKSRQFHRALNGENPSNSFRFTFWPMGGPLWVKWAIMGQPIYVKWANDMMLHKYKLGQFHSSYGENPAVLDICIMQSLDPLVPDLTRFGPKDELIWCKWANGHDAALLQGVSEWLNLTDSRQQDLRCTTTGLDNYIEHWME